MIIVDDFIVRGALITEPYRAGCAQVIQTMDEIQRSQQEQAEVVRHGDDLHPAWIVLGVLLVAAEYFWLFSVTG